MMSTLDDVVSQFDECYLELEWLFLTKEEREEFSRQSDVTVKKVAQAPLCPPSILVIIRE